MQRFEFPGSLVHIMARGLDGKKIFLDDADRKEFLTRLSREIANCGYRCLAWCLQSNHYHLFVRSNENPMSSLMRPLNGGYARWFNEKYRRRGYLFQDRFKSILCQDQEYARQLIRYIHLNPVRSGEVKTLQSLKRWSWCGHRYLLGDLRAPGGAFQDRTEALRRFGSSLSVAVESYKAYLAEGISKEPRKAGQLTEESIVEERGSNKGWPAVIGDAEFAKSAMSRHEVSVRRKHRQIDYRPTIAKIAKDVSAVCGVSLDEIFQRGRRNNRTAARELLCYRVHYEEKIPFHAIARYLGITIPPVAVLARQGKARLRRK